MAKNLKKTGGVKYAGVPFMFGEKEYIVPPLSIAGVEAHEADIEQVQKEGEGSLKMGAKVALVCQILLTALKRNYKDMTLENIREDVDLGNVQDILQAVLGLSGFEEKPATGE